MGAHQSEGRMKIHKEDPAGTIVCRVGYKFLIAFSRSWRKVTCKKCLRKYER